MSATFKRAAMLGAACLMLLGACATQNQQPPSTGATPTTHSRDVLQDKYSAAVGRAKALMNERDFDAAKTELEKAETIAREFGPNNVVLATTKSHFGELYIRMGNLEDAAASFQEAERIFEDGLGADHFAVAVTLDQLAKVRQMQLHPEDSMPLLTRALAICERAESDPQFGDRADHLIPMIKTDQAHGYFLMHQYDKAEQLVAKNIKEISNSTQPNRLALAGAQSVASDIYEKRGQYKEAIEAAESALSNQEAVFGDRSTNLIPMLYNLGKLYSENGDPGKGEKYNRRARAVAAGTAN